MEMNNSGYFFEKSMKEHLKKNGIDMPLSETLS